MAELDQMEDEDAQGLTVGGGLAVHVVLDHLLSRLHLGAVLAVPLGNDC